MDSPKQDREFRVLRMENLEDRRVLSLDSAFTIAVGDFDRDGEDDLAIGKPYETVGYKKLTGLVEVVYGKTYGVSYLDRQTLHQDMPGVVGESGQRDNFGWSLAVGDFNNDGFDDLAVGAPKKTVKGKDYAGSVSVFYGSPNGLSTSNDQWWHQAKGIIGVVETDDQFGYSLAAGDFNKDGYDDLAIGVAEEDHTRNGTVMTDAGQVNVIYGSGSGLRAAGNQVLWQGRQGIRDRTEKYDRFGEVLTVGDFDRDGYDDLAVGVPQENWGPLNNSGVVHVIYGSAAGLTGLGDDLWHQNVPGIWNDNEADDFFGRALAAGDFNRDGFDDLAIGVSDEDFFDSIDSGAVQVIYGSSPGLTSRGARAFNQESSGLWGTRNDYDRFGRRLAVGDFDKDGFDDLAIGVPEEDFGPTPNSGVTQVLYGKPTGLSTKDSQVWHQNKRGIWSSNENHDRFGSALATGDFNGDGFTDLAVEVEGEDFNNATNHGLVQVLWGRPSGLTGNNSQLGYTRTYRIDVVFKDNNLTVAKQKAVIRAADRWSQIIFGDLPNFTVSGLAEVDDLMVEVSAEFIDGVGGVLAQAGSRVLRSGSNLPATADMIVDYYDRNDSQFYDVVLHEFGHALGFVGWVIRTHRLFNYDETRFVGANAAAQYQALGYNYSSVPTEKGEGHWRESIFKNELMTPYIDSNMKLSKVTVGALEDLGYTVSYNQADYFSLGNLQERVFERRPQNSDRLQEALTANPVDRTHFLQPELVIDFFALDRSKSKTFRVPVVEAEKPLNIPTQQSLQSKHWYQLDNVNVLYPDTGQRELNEKVFETPGNQLDELNEQIINPIRFDLNELE